MEYALPDRAPKCHGTQFALARCCLALHKSTPFQSTPVSSWLRQPSSNLLVIMHPGMDSWAVSTNTDNDQPLIRTLRGNLAAIRAAETARRNKNNG